MGGYFSMSIKSVQKIDFVDVFKFGFAKLASFSLTFVCATVCFSIFYTGFSTVCLFINVYYLLLIALVFYMKFLSTPYPRTTVAVT